jgi:hypothetical protein
LRTKFLGSLFFVAVDLPPKYYQNLSETMKRIFISYLCLLATSSMMSVEPQKVELIVKNMALK